VGVQESSSALLDFVGVAVAQFAGEERAGLDGLGAARTPARDTLSGPQSPASK